MLTYEEFEVQLIKALKQKYPGAKITHTSPYKFNKIKKGLLIEGTGNKHADPVVYPEGLYEAYRHFEDMDFILENLDFATSYQMINQVKDILKNYDQATHYIYPYVVNAEKNIQCMECNDYIYHEKLDLLYSVYMEVPDDHGNACINITNELLKKWNVSKEEVFAIAMNNAKYDVKPMRQVAMELLGVDELEFDFSENDSMYVVKSVNHNRGAAAMFDMKLLSSIAEQFQMNDFYILPSSLFEIILISNKDAPKKELLREMVVEVNNTEVSDEEFLSNNIYYYNNETNSVEIVSMD